MARIAHVFVQGVQTLGLVLCCVALNGSAWAAEKDANAVRLAEFRSIAFGHVKEVAVARLEGHAKGDFHGLKMTGDWVKLGTPAQADLTALLQGVIDGWIRLYADAKGEVLELEPFCIPDYGYAIRLQTDQGVRDFAICLHCGQVAAYGRKRQGVAFVVKGETLDKLKACYRDEFGSGPQPAGKP